MIVADTNLVAQLILRLDITESAQEVYRRDPAWLLPELWRHEFLNVLASYNRFDRVPYAKLLAAWTTAGSLFDRSTRQVDMPQALRIAGERNISAYDAQFVALAQTHRVPLITHDRRLLRAAPETAVTARQYLESGRR